MALTKAQYRSMTRQYLDDPNAKRWSDSFIDLAIQLVIDDMWTDILDMAPFITSQLQTISSLHSPGYIDLRLAAQGGDLTQRFYRIQLLKAPSSTSGQAARIYYPKDPRDYLLGGGDNSVIVASRFSYEVKGDQVWLYSSDMQFGPAPVDLRYSFKPMPFTAFADGNNIPFPEGSELAPILAAAANTMAKGNAEDAAQLIILADRARDKMLAAVRRQYHGALSPYTTGTAVEYGGT